MSAALEPFSVAAEQLALEVICGILQRITARFGSAMKTLTAGWIKRDSRPYCLETDGREVTP